MVSRLLNILGFSLGEDDQLMEPHVDNPSGFWERKDVFELHQEILEEAGSRWDTVIGNEVDRLKPSRRASFSRRIVEILERLNSSEQWAVKDPRFCTVFPLWRGMLRKPVVVFVTRDPAQIVASLESRNGLPRLVGVSLCESYFLAFLKSTRGIPRVFVRHEDLLADPYGTTCALRGRLEDLGASGLRRSCRGEVESFIDAGLFRSRADGSLVSDFLNDQRRRLFEDIVSGCPSDDWSEVELSRDSFDALTMFRDFQEFVNLTIHRRADGSSEREGKNGADQEVRSGEDASGRDPFAEEALKAVRDLEDRVAALSTQLGTVDQGISGGFDALRDQLTRSGLEIHSNHDSLSRELEDLGRGLEGLLSEYGDRVDRFFGDSALRFETDLEGARTEAREWEERAREALGALENIHRSKFWRVWMTYHRFRRRLSLSADRREGQPLGSIGDAGECNVKTT